MRNLEGGGPRQQRWEAGELSATWSRGRNSPENRLPSRSGAGGENWHCVLPAKRKGMTLKTE